MKASHKCPNRSLNYEVYNSKCSLKDDKDNYLTSFFLLCMISDVEDL